MGEDVLMAAEMLHCGLCGAERPRGSCHIIAPTDAEKQQIRVMGQEPEKEYIYCKPCWRTLSNPVSGPAVMKGLVQSRLRQLGVGNADKIAERYHDRLVAKIKPRPS